MKLSYNIYYQIKEEKKQTKTQNSIKKKSQNTSSITKPSQTNKKLLQFILYLPLSWGDIYIQKTLYSLNRPWQLCTAFQSGQAV